MNKVNVFGHKSGTLGKVNKISDIETGLQLVVQNSGYSTGHRAQPQVGHFTQVAFDPPGHRLIAADHLGHFYLLDLTRCRFEHILHSRHPCTALNFALRDRRQFLAAFADSAVRLLTLTTPASSTTSAALETSCLSGHESAVNCVSVHCAGRHALTTDPDVTLLWDLDTCARLRRLSVREDVQLLSATFVPGRNLILTAFRDDSLFLWDSESLQCRGQLPTPPNPAPSAGASADGELGQRYRCLDSTPDGRRLVACGRTRQLHVWDLESLQLSRVLELPSAAGDHQQLCPLRQVAFADPAGSMLLVVAHSGDVACVTLGGSGGGGSAALTNRLQSVGGGHVTRLAVSPDRVALVSAGQLVLHCLAVVLRPQSARAALSARAAANAAAAAASAGVPWPMKEPVTDRTEGASSRGTGGGDTGRTYTVQSGGLSPTKTSKSQQQQQQQQSQPLPQPEPLNRKRLRAVLQEFGQFPSKYRLLIWKTLLQLPENAQAFSALHDKGVHPAYLNLQERFPLRSNKLGRVLQRTLSCVAFWSPLFGEADYLPLLAFPFVKMFQNSQLHAVEALMTLLLNWCGHWFEYFPNPPLNILAMVENLIAHHDKELYAHLCAKGVTSEVMAWPLLQTLLTEVLTRDEWLSVWDQLLCQPPGYLLYCVAAFTLVSRGPLLRATELREFESFYRQPGCVGGRDLVRQARQIKSRTPAEVCPCRQLPGFAPLGGPQYPMFNRYPVFIVDYQVRERERLRDEERRYLEERRALEAAQRRSETQRAEEAAWCRQQELLLQAEDRRRQMMSREEAALRDQRRRLADEQRRARLEELAALSAQRQRLRSLQLRHRQVETQRMGDRMELREADDDPGDDSAARDSDNVEGVEARRLNVGEAGALLSELEGVCQDNGQLEADVGRLLDRLQAARQRLAPGPAVGQKSGAAAVTTATESSDESSSGDY